MESVRLLSCAVWLEETQREEGVWVLELSEETSSISLISGEDLGKELSDSWMQLSLWG